MIGNDIVDLAQAKRESNWRRRGYVDKIFTAYEQELIRQANDSDLMVWLLWSMKESAYKANVRQTQNRIFAPVKIACELHSLTSGAAEGHVLYDYSYQTRSVITPHYICTTASVSQNPATYTQIVIAFTSTTYQTHQQQIREKARQHSAAVFGVQERGMHIHKDGIGAPLLTVGDSVTTPISFSHHGQYGAFVM